MPAFSITAALRVRIAPADQLTRPLLASVRVSKTLNPSVSIVSVAPEAIVVVPVPFLDPGGPLEAARHGQLPVPPRLPPDKTRSVIVGLALNSTVPPEMVVFAGL